MTNYLSSIEHTKLSNYVNHSGGARGSDSEWDNIGREYGMYVNNHYYAEGEKTPKGNIPLTKKQLLEADPYLIQVNKILKRRFPTKNEYVNNLLRRNYYQVIGSEAIFAIASITNNLVDGGTGWAVHMGIFMNRNVYVFDQRKNQWFTWSNVFPNPKFIECDVPVLTMMFAGIGTREIDENGLKAIRNVYENSIK